MAWKSNDDPVIKVWSKVKLSSDKIKSLVISELSQEILGHLASEKRDGFGKALQSDDWRRAFRGTDMLSSFANKYCRNLKYQTMRDMIVNSMAEAGYRPLGMVKVIAQIDNS